MWVGWVTSDFHPYDLTFDTDSVHTVTVTLGDDSGKVLERLVCTNKSRDSTRLLNTNYGQSHNVDLCCRCFVLYFSVWHETHFCTFVQCEAT